MPTGCGVGGCRGMRLPGPYSPHLTMQTTLTLSCSPMRRGGDRPYLSGPIGRDGRERQREPAIAANSFCCICYFTGCGIPPNNTVASIGQAVEGGCGGIYGMDRTMGVDIHPIRGFVLNPQQRHFAVGKRIAVQRCITSIEIAG